jgi:hypothetical protein
MIVNLVIKIFIIILSSLMLCTLFLFALTMFVSEIQKIKKTNKEQNNKKTGN